MIRLLENKEMDIEEIIKRYDDGDINIMPKNDEIPMPWDADIELEGDTVVITGALTPGGASRGDAVCQLKIKKDKFLRFYKIM